MNYLEDQHVPEKKSNFTILKVVHMDLPTIDYLLSVLRSWRGCMVNDFYVNYFLIKILSVYFSSYHFLQRDRLKETDPLFLHDSGLNHQ